MPAKYPPGPRDGLLGITFHRRLAAAPLAFAAEVARDYGDFAYVRVGWVRLYFVNRPALIREVLVTKLKSFRKLGRQMHVLRKIEGDGLVVAEGETWQRHRPVVQGNFHARHFDQYARVVVEYTRRRLERWRPGLVLDLAQEMNELALEIIAKVVFDVDWSGQAPVVRQAVHTFRSAMQKEIGFVVMLPDWLPLPFKIRQRRAARALDDLIWELIRQRRASGIVKIDMLSLMLAAASAVRCNPAITDAEIRDEAATLVVAGHETGSAALAWLWLLLARHPEHERRVLQEIDTVLGARAADYDDLPRLKYLEMVVKESMRLYPAAGFLFGREAVEDVELGGYIVPRGSWVFISPYLVHRDSANFPEPEVFDPLRFGPGRADDILPYSYLPFGGGPRTCIGNGFAMMEIMLLAATVLQEYQLRLENERQEVESELEVVLRVKGELRIRPVSRRAMRRAV